MAAGGVEAGGGRVGLEGLEFCAGDEMAGQPRSAPPMPDPPS